MIGRTLLGTMCVKFLEHAWWMTATQNLCKLFEKGRRIFQNNCGSSTMELLSCLAQQSSYFAGSNVRIAYSRLPSDRSQQGLKASDFHLFPRHPRWCRQVCTTTFDRELWSLKPKSPVQALEKTSFQVSYFNSTAYFRMYCTSWSNCFFVDVSTFYCFEPAEDPMLLPLDSFQNDTAWSCPILESSHFPIRGAWPVLDS